MLLPSTERLQELLDQCRPITVLKELQEEVPVELAIYKAQAFLCLDRIEEASQLLEQVIDQLHGDELARAKRYWSQILLVKNQADEAIFVAQSATQVAESREMRAHAMVELASGYSRKTCRKLAEDTLRDAKALIGPNDPILLLGEAHLMLDMDERLAARAIYDRLAEYDIPWAQFYANSGRSIVALLLGDFEEVCNRANVCLQISDEMIWPHYLLAQLAVIEEDAPRLEQILDQIAQLSPQARLLSSWRSMLALLKKRQEAPTARRRRLKAFPTTMQKRNYCGPSTIDLILRFWKLAEIFTDDQIAAYVKLPHGGTPPYRMQEFFHMVGFDTIRCIASIEQLKQLIDAGYPVIVQEEFPDNSHVAVVIGYDEAERVIEFQDPMTHQVIALPEEIVNRLRRTYLDSALIVFPQGKGHEKELALLGFFDEPAIIWTDEAEQAMERRQFQEVTTLMERAVQRLPTHPLSWIIWLSAELQNWQYAARRPSFSRFSRARQGEPNPADARKRFFNVLHRARELFPESKFVHAYFGYSALQNGDAKSALASFKRASETDPGDSRNFAAMAECNFVLRNTDQALEMAREALNRNSGLPVNNLWMGRCLAARNDQTSEHYARCALELAPDWWMAHQTLAEVYLSKRDHPSARRELELALALAPNQPEARIQRALLAMMDGYHEYAIRELEETLKAARNLPLYAEYNARQALCRAFFGSRKFDRARKQIGKLLRMLPEDPWSLQFLAAATSEGLHRTGYQQAEAARQVRQLYAKALRANQGITSIANDYLNYLASFETIKAILDEIVLLCANYPESKGLLGMQARWLSRAGLQADAARLMLEAVNAPGGIQGADDLYNAVQIIIGGLGIEVAEPALLSTSIPDGTPALLDRQRALGLVLASDPKKYAIQASQLLKIVLESNPRDSFVILRLGDLANDAQEREELYRCALQYSPGWPYVRVYLANYLTGTGRAREALSFTEGHKSESVDIMVASGRALFALGRYDEAVRSYRAAIAGKEQPEAWLYDSLWQAETRSGDHRAALLTSRKALRLYPREVRWYATTAKSFRNLGQFFQAARMIQQGLTAGLPWVAYLESEYETALAQGRFRTALRLEEKLAKWEKPDGEKYLSRSEERRFRVLLKLRRIKQAREIIDGKTWFKSAEAWHTSLWICLETAAWDLASELAQRALVHDEQDFTGLFARAEILAETGHLEKAMVALDNLRTMHPYEHNSYEKLAVYYAMAGQMEQAMEMAERAVLLGPFCPFALATRGYIYFLSNQWEAARADLELAWRQTNFSQRHESFAFWWILASLQNNPILALYRQSQAWREAHTDWRRPQVHQIRKHLNQTAMQRLHYSLAVAWPGRLVTKNSRDFFHVRTPK